MSMGSAQVARKKIGAAQADPAAILTPRGLVALSEVGDGMAVAFATVGFLHTGSLYLPSRLADLFLVFASVLLTVIVRCVFGAWRLYCFSMLLRRTSAVRAAVAWTVTASPFVGLAAVWDSGSDAERHMLEWYGVGLAMIVALRLLLAHIGSHMRQAGTLGYRIGIVGEPAALQRCRETLAGSSHPLMAGSVVATATWPPADVPSVEHMIDRFRSARVEKVILAVPLQNVERINATVRMLRTLPIHVLLAPLAASHRGGASAENLQPLTDDMVLIELARRPLAGWNWVWKDITERGLAALFLLLALPAFILIACAIKLSSAGPVFYRQARRGYRGIPFHIYKFRTMDAAASNKPASALELTTRDDPRIFPVGRFLRKSSLDEIPQLLNVIRGEMWLIGPRPHPLFAKAAGIEYARAVSDYASRYRIKPGITGWAQVNGWRGPTETIEQITRRVEYDLFYIDNWSLRLDLKILWRTLGCVLPHENAF